MQLVILAGGYGSRLSEETILKPKPMIEIGNMPIIWHIMMHYNFYGVKDFIIAAGYKSEVIKSFFLNYMNNHCDVKISFKQNKITFLNKKKLNWTVTVVDTGKGTETGSRIKKIQKYLNKNKAFFLTYGDGVSDLNIDEELRYHKKNKSKVTVCAVKPPGRFGAIEKNGNLVTSFGEKKDNSNNWINAGYFICDYSIFKDIPGGENYSWENNILPKFVKEKQLITFNHYGFWSPMDTLSDKKKLELLWSSSAPWKLW